MLTIRRIELPAIDIVELATEARSEGFGFIDRLVLDWATGENRFALIGERLCGAFQDLLLIGIAGLNKDPFTNSPRIGRLRHMYVRPNWRRLGAGAMLASDLLQNAISAFDCIRIRTDRADAAHFYARIGFTETQQADATHMMPLKPEQLLRRSLI